MLALTEQLQRHQRPRPDRDHLPQSADWADVQRRVGTLMALAASVLAGVAFVFLVPTLTHGARPPATTPPAASPLAPAQVPLVATVVATHPFRSIRSRPKGQHDRR